ncbi:hypothetical protein GLYMA_12G091450v4 [Glycine max]|nr:hypothetical protein GLYMA_12G091450v4 [Glycine max]KAH1142357.1 hypothetical protein GYH30_033164 [Glycine max]
MLLALFLRIPINSFALLLLKPLIYRPHQLKVLHNM